MTLYFIFVEFNTLLNSKLFTNKFMVNIKVNKNGKKADKIK